MGRTQSQKLARLWQFNAVIWALSTCLMAIGHSPRGALMFGCVFVLTAITAILHTRRSHG